MNQITLLTIQSAANIIALCKKYFTLKQAKATLHASPFKSQKENTKSLHYRKPFCFFVHMLKATSEVHCRIFAHIAKRRTFAWLHNSVVSKSTQCCTYEQHGHIRTLREEKVNK